MSNLVTVLTVFSSSPSDVTSERIALLRAIERANRISYIRERFVIRPFRFEDLPPHTGEEAQVVVDNACSIEECYLVVCILWRRMGTPFLHPDTKQRYLSGTEYEFTTAYNTYLSKGQPYVLLYRKTSKTLQEPKANNTDQYRLIEEFFAKFEGSSRKFQGLYVQFSATEEFEDRVLLDIINYIHDYPPSHRPEVELPGFVEENRRLDVAIPPEARLDDTIELWVKICTEKSPGLREDLQEEPEAPGVPSVSDTKNKFMSVAFEKKNKDGGISPLRTVVEIISLDFEVLDGSRFIELRMGLDSPTLVFPLHVITQGTSGHVQVRVKTKSIHADYWVENGSLSCQVRIRRKPVLTQILSVFSAMPRKSLNDIKSSINKQEKEISLINETHKRFGAIMDSAKGGIQSEAQFSKILRDMKDLKSNMSSYQSRVSSPEAKHALKTLEDAIDKNLSQLNSMKSSVAESRDKKIVDDEVNFFNMIMEGLNSGTIKFESYKQLKTFADLVDNKIKAVHEKYYQVSSPGAKSVLSQLEDAWKKLRSQIKV